jgi:hypothetical protein
MPDAGCRMPCDTHSFLPCLAQFCTHCPVLSDSGLRMLRELCPNFTTMNMEYGSAPYLHMWPVCDA